MLDGVLDAFLRCWMHLQGCVLANTVLDESFRVLDGVLGAVFKVLDAFSGCWMGCWMLF